MTSYLMDTLSICKAKSKQSGIRCKNFVVKGKEVCHIHGGKSTGAKTTKGKIRQKMASWEHGERSLEARNENRCIKKAIKEAQEMLSKF